MYKNTRRKPAKEDFMKFAVFRDVDEKYTWFYEKWG
jgi:hypothetical protein